MPLTRMLCSNSTRTLCGTPNYIAPEILDRKAGHSFPVDVWSIGCIVYTLLCGRPPFETSNIESTYKKIRNNDYRFPSTVRISDEAREIIQWMLSARPEDRPSIAQVGTPGFWFLCLRLSLCAAWSYVGSSQLNLSQIREHSFMQGFTPTSLPRSALSRAPHFDEEEVRRTATTHKAHSTRRPLGTVNPNSAPGTHASTKKSAVRSTAPGSLTAAATASAQSAGRYEELRKQLKEESQAALSNVHTTLKVALDRQASAAPSAPATPVSEAQAAENVWISKWVDYSNKYVLLLPRGPDASYMLKLFLSTQGTVWGINCRMVRLGYFLTTRRRWSCHRME